MTYNNIYSNIVIKTMHVKLTAQPLFNGNKIQHVYYLNLNAQLKNLFDIFARVNKKKIKLVSFIFNYKHTRNFQFE